MAAAHRGRPRRGRRPAAPRLLLALLLPLLRPLLPLHPPRAAPAARADAAPPAQPQPPPHVVPVQPAILPTRSTLTHTHTTATHPAAGGASFFPHEDLGVHLPTYQQHPPHPYPPGSAVPPGSFSPVAPGNPVYDQARAALVAKIAASAERFEQAKVASSAGDNERVGALLAANVGEWRYVDSYLQAIDQAGGPDSAGVSVTGQPEVQQYADALENYARFKLSLNELEEAEPLIEETCAMLEKGYGLDHQLTSSCYATRASVLLRLGKNDDLNDLVALTQNKLETHNAQQDVIKMQTRVLDWIDTLPKLDELARKFVAARPDDKARRGLLKKARRQARKISRDEPDRTVAANEYVKVMERVLKDGDGFLTRQRERLERLVKSDGISADKVKQLTTRLGVVRAFRNLTAAEGAFADPFGRTWASQGGAATASAAAAAAARRPQDVSAFEALMSMSAQQLAWLAAAMAAAVGVYYKFLRRDEKSLRAASRRRAQQASVRSIKQRRRGSTDSNNCKGRGVRGRGRSGSGSGGSEGGGKQGSATTAAAAAAPAAATLAAAAPPPPPPRQPTAEEMARRRERQQRRDQRRMLESQRRQRQASTEKQKRERAAQELAEATRAQNELMREIAAAEAAEIASKEAELRELQFSVVANANASSSPQVATPKRPNHAKNNPPGSARSTSSKKSRKKKSSSERSANDSGASPHGTRGRGGNGAGQHRAAPRQAAANNRSNNTGHARRRTVGGSRATPSGSTSSTSSTGSSEAGDMVWGGAGNTLQNLGLDHRSSSSSSSRHNNNNDDEDSKQPGVDSSLNVSAAGFTPAAYASYSSAPRRPVPADPRMVGVSLQLVSDANNIPLRPGQGLFLSSSIHGNWDIEQAVMLSVEPFGPEKPNHYVWSYVMSVPRFVGSFEYKYVVRSLDDRMVHSTLVRWEEGQNRVVDLKLAGTDAPMLYVDDTDVYFRPLDEFLAKPAPTLPLESPTAGAAAAAPHGGDDVMGFGSADDLVSKFVFDDHDLSAGPPRFTQSSTAGLSLLKPTTTLPKNADTMTPVDVLLAGGDGAGSMWGGSGYRRPQHSPTSSAANRDFQQSLLDKAAESLLNR